MKRIIKIQHGKQQIFLTDSPDQYLPSRSSILLRLGFLQELAPFFEELGSQQDLESIWFCYPQLEELMVEFKKMFKVVEAAGGAVKNKEDKWLFIFRNGKWDLPKGKIEKGEGLEEAAIREVEEECGVNGLSIIRPLSTSYHTYTLNGFLVLKPTYWYEMVTSSTGKLTPQIEEGITDVKWLGRSEWSVVENNTFPSILEVMHELN